MHIIACMQEIKIPYLTPLIFHLRAVSNLPKSITVQSNNGTFFPLEQNFNIKPHVKLCCSVPNPLNSCAAGEWILMDLGAVRLEGGRIDALHSLYRTQR